MRMQLYPQLYSTGLNSFKSIIKTEGLAGFYKGLLPPVIGRSSQFACMYTTYRMAQRIIEPIHLPRQVEVCLAGCMSGVTVAFVDTPFELLKLQMQNAGHGRVRSGTDLNQGVKLS